LKTGPNSVTENQACVPGNRKEHERRPLGKKQEKKKAGNKADALVKEKRGPESEKSCSHKQNTHKTKKKTKKTTPNKNPKQNPTPPFSRSRRVQGRGGRRGSWNDSLAKRRRDRWTHSTKTDTLEKKKQKLRWGGKCYEGGIVRPTPHHMHSYPKGGNISAHVQGKELTFGKDLPKSGKLKNDQKQETQKLQRKKKKGPSLARNIDEALNTEHPCRK